MYRNVEAISVQYCFEGFCCRSIYLVVHLLSEMYVVQFVIECDDILTTCSSASSITEFALSHSHAFSLIHQSLSKSI